MRRGLRSVFIPFMSLQPRRLHDVLINEGSASNGFLNL